MSIAETTGPGRDPGTGRWLLAFAVAYGVLHHQGFLFAGLGPLPGVADDATRVADWLDLLTPFVVLGPALAALWTLGPIGRVPWLVALVGTIAYVEGHGIHLAANSISNEQVDLGRRPSPVTHLWDEPVSHHLWFAGLALVIGALVAATHRRYQLGRGPVVVLLSLQFGLTWTTNGLEGGTAIFSCLVAAGFVAVAVVVWRRGDDGLATALLWCFVPALVSIGGYGVLNRGFPQPSEIGWGVFG